MVNGPQDVLPSLIAPPEQPWHLDPIAAPDPQPYPFVVEWQLTPSALDSLDDAGSGAAF